jgi:diguanylate cyclase (GGDEF)-like protein
VNRKSASGSSLVFSKSEKSISIMHQFVLYTAIISIFCCFILSVFIVVIELDDFLVERDTIAKERLKSVSVSAAFAAYNLDVRVTKAILLGLKSESIFNKVEIKDNFGDTLYAIDIPHAHSVYPRWVVDFVKGKHNNEIEVPLEIDSFVGNSTRLVNVGSIYAELNEDFALKITFRLLLNIISYSVLITFFIILMICWLFRKQIDSPMASIIKKINEVELYDTDKNKRINLTEEHQSTEFVKLINAYNKSIDRTSDYMEKLHAVTDELRSLSQVDSLTNAWNRRALIEQLNKVCSSEETPKCVVIATDLDNFSEINDTYGHEVGDFVLKNFYQQIRYLLPKNAFISRTGGDEFVVILPRKGLEEIGEIRQLLSNLTKLTPGHQDIIHHQYIEASFGIAVFPEHGREPRDLLNCADLALYDAKNEGKRCVELFNPSMYQASEQRIKIHRQLDELIEKNSFLLFYQPKVRLCDGQVIGCEALLRLPNNRNSAPFELIDSAEKSGLIVPLGAAILERAFNDYVNFIEYLPFNFRMSVNVSTKQFEADNFIPVLSSLSGRTGFPLSRLDIELTESAEIEYSDSLAEKRNWLKSQGCSLTLDDFGTGFASLEYLIKFAFDQVKIDKAFVSKLPDDERSQTINRVVKFLSEQFQMSIVAEGIETHLQEEWLAELGIDYGQGYLYAKAEPMHCLIERIEKPLAAVK